MRSIVRSTVVHVAFAFLAMGGWAFHANSGHGLDAARIPAVTQGVLSGLITLVLKRLLEALCSRVPGALAYVVPPAITASTTLVVLVSIHGVVGTPEVARTVAVPWSVSTLYAVVYAAVLARERTAR